MFISVGHCLCFPIIDLGIGIEAKPLLGMYFFTIECHDVPWCELMC